MPKARAPQPAKSAADQLRIAQRRRQVVANWVAGATYRQISTAMGISIGTISNDITAICADLQFQSREEFYKIKMRQFLRYDFIINANWDKMRNGDTRAAEIVLKAMEAQNKLMGLNAPQAVDLTSDREPLRIVIEHIEASRGGNMLKAA